MTYNLVPPCEPEGRGTKTGGEPQSVPLIKTKHKTYSTWGPVPNTKGYGPQNWTITRNWFALAGMPLSKLPILLQGHADNPEAGNPTQRLKQQQTTKHSQSFLFLIRYGRPRVNSNWVFYVPIVANSKEDLSPSGTTRTRNNSRNLYSHFTF